MDMLLELTDAHTKDTVYVTDFEGRFIDASSEYYRVEGQLLVEEFDAPEYMTNVGKFLHVYMLRTRDDFGIIKIISRIF